MIVAIDGPAGSGKSSTARALAERTGFLYLDTGAMYRAVAFRFLETGVEPTQISAADLLDRLTMDVESGSTGMRVFIDGRDVTEYLRSEEVTNLSSVVSALQPVRTRLVTEQRRIAEREGERGGGVIVEGRDIGTVVFPDAELKIYLDADPQERAKRRITELEQGTHPLDAAKIEADIRERDHRDLTREISPLKQADDAVVVNTTHLTLSEQVDLIEKMIWEQRS